MNKKSVLLGLVIVFIVTLATGCLFYKALDGSEFKNHFGELGYTISDSEEAKYEAKTYLVASKEDLPFKIEYYEFKDEVEAKKVTKKFQDTIGDYITTDSKNQTTTGAQITKTVAVSEKEYIVISRVKNTVIFIAGLNEYDDEINKLLEDIKY